MSADNTPPTKLPFTGEEHDLHDALLYQAGRIAELLEESDEHALKAQRFDEGVACLQWQLARVGRHGAASIKASVMLRCLDELVAFANQGREPGWLKLAREEMGR